MKFILTFQEIQEAQKRIEPFIHRTPIFTSQTLNKRLGNTLFFKAENLQRSGSFNFGGAFNALFSLSDSSAALGVCTHSSGNHAQALALAARLRGIPSFIVMPQNAPDVKKAGVAGYGAQIFFCEPTLEACETRLAQVAQETQATFIHPYEDPRVMAGQGTSACEFFQQVSDLDILMTPVGGGGLLSGTAVANASLSPKTKVIGVEPQGADDAYQSWKAGIRIPAVHPRSIADGLLTSLGHNTFPLIQHYVSEICTVSETQIQLAMHFIWERMKLVVEPSAAVPLAALLQGKLKPQQKKIGIILSGGNVDLEKLPWLSKA
jgi:threonine dehydratase